MNRYIYLWLFSWLLPLALFAQGENNIWTFATGSGANNRVLNFNGTSPTITDIPSPYDEFGYGGMVCYPNGQPRFFVRLANYISWAIPRPAIFTATGVPVPNSALKSQIPDEDCMPVIIPHPANSDQYYIFYAYNHALLYSLLDMSLNSGIGGIVAGQKDIMITSLGQVLAQKMTPVLGCNGVWLVVRSRIANQFLSFSVTNNGLDTSAVVSDAGHYGVTTYNWSGGVGFLKASPNGEKLVITGFQGIELFDFEKCSGKISNYGILDTTGNVPITTAISFLDHIRFDGVCFSPDNSKLYASRIVIDNLIGLHRGELYQYNMDLPDITAMTGSKTLVLENLPSIMESIGACDLVLETQLGEIKAGSDGRLYVDNGSHSCLAPINIPATYNPGPAFHTINQPNLPGVACNPELNTVIVNTNPNIAFPYGEFYHQGISLSRLPQEIIVAPQPVDTIIGLTVNLTACFKDSIEIALPEQAKCVFWNNETKKHTRIISQTGTYWAGYFKDCVYRTDTFHVKLLKLPNLSIYQKSCEGMSTGTLLAVMPDDNTITLQYTWKDEEGVIKQQHSHAYSDTISHLKAGNYSVRITSTSGCDTTLSISLDNHPSPQISVSPIDTIIKYGDAITLNASGALYYAWWPGKDLDTTITNTVRATPIEPSTYFVLGINEYGCRDTGIINIDIDYKIYDLIPNAFSPNNDGINDMFGIAGLKYQIIEKFQIFNRWGQLVFSTLDPNRSWDGNYNGKNCEVGNYNYFIQLAYPDGSRKTFRGDVLLIR